MSSKLRDATSASDDNCALDMSPMIDMVFLLLIFFVVNSSQAIVKQDADVRPPIASFGKKQEDKNGRIVVNVFKDGSFKTERGANLETDDDIFDLVKKAKEENDLRSYKSKLHLRGDKEAVFKYSRKIIAISAKAGVDQVMFATYSTDK
ncbi:MAG: ExbD/TolR family protein [Akkermansiaceae bacterium]|jgi:biopolymer transport protein ExbD